VVNARPTLLLTNLASLCFGFAMFATLIGTAPYVQAPAETGYGFNSSVLVSGLAMVPGALAMVVLSPVSAHLIERIGPRATLCIGSLIVALGFAQRIVMTDEFWYIVLGTTIAGAGTAIGYAAMPSLILRGAPRSELAACNSLNTLARTGGSSLASAIGGTLLAAMTVTVAGSELPSLSGYRWLFAICSVGAVFGAVVALCIPRADGET
jgi:MFS family permease